MKRKTPLKRKTALKKGKRLAPQSPAKKRWLKLYQESVANDPILQRDAFSGKVVLKERLEIHHPFGRKNKYLLIYCYIDPSQHRWIHDHGGDARAQGWLQGPYEGKPLDDRPRPWQAETLKNEHLLTEDL